MRAPCFLCFFASMSLAFAGIDESLDALNKKYGQAERNTYRPDLYPTPTISGGVVLRSPSRQLPSSRRRSTSFLKLSRQTPLKSRSNVILAGQSGSSYRHRIQHSRSIFRCLALKDGIHFIPAEA